MKIEPVQPQPPHRRYTARPLPPYRYIPGINKHPVRDPSGHSYRKEHAPLAFVDPKDWRANEEYLFGVDLYNNAYWWEAHEAWENVWHTTDKDAPYGQCLQGLIQIAAAFIKWHSRERGGVEKLFAIGISRLKFTRDAFPTFLGIDLKTHVAKLEAHFARVLGAKDAWPEALEGYPFLELISDGF